MKQRAYPLVQSAQEDVRQAIRQSYDYIFQLEAQLAKYMKVLLTPAGVPVAGNVIQDTHANRVLYPAVDYPLGSFYIETDRTDVVYVNQLTSGANAWVYLSGMMRNTYANRPTDLIANDAGFLFENTGPGYIYRWSGTAWVALQFWIPYGTIEQFGSEPILQLLRANGNPGARTAVLDTEIIGVVGVAGYGASGYPAADLASITAVAAENFSDTKGGTHLVISTTPKLSVTQAERIRVTSEGNVGVNDSTPTAKFDVSGMIRSTDTNTPADGVGVEVLYTGVLGIVNAYDRAASTFKEMRVQGSILTLNVNAACGNVLVKTATDNAAGGVLQINGDVTPDIDSGGSLGTATVQWTDLRLSGTPYIGAAPGIDQVVALAKLTALGADGSATFTKGILTAYSAPT
jgi:hypothetical protein